MFILRKLSLTNTYRSVSDGNNKKIRSIHVFKQIEGLEQIFNVLFSSVNNGRSSISKNLCSKSTHKSIKTQLIEHRIEWKAIIITLIEMSGRKRKQLTLGS